MKYQEYLKLLKKCKTDYERAMEFALSHYTFDSLDIYKEI